MPRNRGAIVSETPFFGAKKKFRYYDRHGEEHFVYASKKPRRKSIFSFLMTVFIYLCMIGFMGFGCINYIVTSKVPEPLIPLDPRPDVYIEDTIQVIDNKEALEKTLREFEDMTGISPYILTVHHSDWKEEYYGLINYAVDVYMDRFEDQQHFLLVYSEADETADVIDWEFDAFRRSTYSEDIITKEHFDRFQRTLQTGLSDESVSVGEAFQNAFADSMGYMMDAPADAEYAWIYIGLLGIFVLILVWAMFGYIVTFFKGRRNYEEVPMNAEDLRKIEDSKKWLIDRGVKIKDADYEAGRDSMEDRYGEVNGYDIDGYVLNGKYVDKDKS